MKTGCSCRNLGNNILKEVCCASLTVLKKIAINKSEKYGMSLKYKLLWK